MGSPVRCKLQEANRECQRLHRQLEEATAAHKAFAAEASAREARMQAHVAEREATLQVRGRAVVFQSFAARIHVVCCLLAREPYSLLRLAIVAHVRLACDAGSIMLNMLASSFPLLAGPDLGP